MSLKSFLFLDSPVWISCQWDLLWMKWERANLAHTWRANWSDLSWLSLPTGREGQMGEEVINRDVNTQKYVKPNNGKKKKTPQQSQSQNSCDEVTLPSSCAMLCLWLTEALFQMASSTRLPNLEQAIWTYWPWEDKNRESDDLTKNMTYLSIHISDTLILNYCRHILSAYVIC